MFRKVKPLIPGLILSFILLALFYLLRSRAHVYGDGFLVLDNHSDLSSPIDFSVNFMKPLVVIFHRVSFKILSGLFTTMPANILGLVNAVGGVVAFWALYFISQFLVEERKARFFLLLGALTSGAVILFFGYIENYTWPLALGLWTMTLTVGYIKSRIRLWPALLCGVVAFGFHIFCLPFLMSAIFAAFYKLKNKEPGSLRFSWGYFNLFIVFISFIIALVFQLTNLPPYLVKLWPVADQPYWFLSGQHLVDVVNELVMVSPLGLGVGLFSLLTFRKSFRNASPVEHLLLTLSVMTFLVTFWSDPQLGAARDWDFLSFVGFPFSIWAALRLHRLFPGMTSRSGTVVMAGVLVVVGLIPNLYEKNNLDIAVIRLDDILWQDIHYKEEYHQAERCDSWAYTLKLKVGDFKRAEKYYQRRLETDEGSAIWLYGLGKKHFQAGRIDSAFTYLHRAALVDTGNADLMANLAIASNMLGKDSEAVIYARKAVDLMDSSNVNVLTQVGMVFSKPGLMDEALYCYHKAFQLAPTSYKQAIYLGQFYYRQKEFDSAFVYLNRGLELSGDILLNDARFLYQLAFTETELEKFEPALEHCRRARRLMPVKPEINTLCEKIEQVLGQGK